MYRQKVSLKEASDRRHELDFTRMCINIYVTWKTISHYQSIMDDIFQGTCRVVTAIPIEKQLKEQARDVIDSLKNHGFDEIDICDLEFNSLER